VFEGSFCALSASDYNVYVVIRAMIATIHTIKTGNGFFSSAISGARMVMPLANI
jgi:hypothetical protein